MVASSQAPLARWALIALLAGAAVPAVGQGGGGRAGACPRPDTTASWFATQRESLDDSQRAWTDDPLRNALLQAAGLSVAQAIRPNEGWQLSDRTAVPPAPRDTMLTMLSSLARARGSTWPTREVVGAAGARAVWALVQRDTALERAALRRMMEAGPGASVPADVAVLEDRVRLLSGRKQLYGTQMRSEGGGPPRPLAIEDSAHVDLRRIAAGLPPLKHAVCAAGARS